MPCYEYRCEECAHEFEVILRMSEYDLPQNCPECQAGPAKKRVPRTMNVIFAGDNWVSKNNLIEGQMKDKDKRLSKRQEERKREGSGMTLAPNVGGERVESWSDAARLARSQGKDTTVYEKKAAEAKK